MDTFDCLPDAVCITDKNGVILRANKHFFQTISKSERTIGHSFIEEVIHTIDREKVQKGMFETLSKKIRSVIGRCRTLTFEGEHEFPVFRQYDWVLSPGSEANTVIASGRIVSAKERIEADIESEEELLDFFQNAPIALHWLSDKGIIIWANNTELRSLGYTAEEYIGQPVMKFCPDDEALVLEIFKQLGTGQTIRDVPVRFRSKNGDLKYLLIDSNVNYNVDGTFRHTRCFIRDDTGRIVRDAVARYEKEMAALKAKDKDYFHRGLIQEMTEYLHQIETKPHASTLFEKELVASITTFLQYLTHIEKGEVIILSPKQMNLELSLNEFVNKNKSFSHSSHLVLRHHNIPKYVSMDPALYSLVLQPILNFSLTHVAKGKNIDMCVFHAVTYFTFKFEFVTSSHLDAEIVLKSMHSCYSNCTLPDTKASLNLGLFIANNVVQSLNCFIEFYSDGNEAVIQCNLPLKVLSLSSPPPVVSSPQSPALASWSHIERSPAVLAHFVSNESDRTESESICDSQVDVDSVHLDFGDIDTMSDKDFEITKKMQSMMVNKLSGGETGASKETILDVARKGSDGVSFLGLENGRKRRILLVDDSAICTNMLSRSLQKVGYAVDSAINGKESIKLLSVVPCMFDAVIMDVVMPIMNGIEATKVIRNDLKLKHLPIIVLTADVAKETQAEAMAAGASDFMLKPVFTKSIIKLLHSKGLFAQVPEDGL